MSDGAKRFSIIITCCNRRNSTQAAIQSALAQPSHLREIIAVDDGSSDGFTEILAQYADSIQTLRLPVSKGANESGNAGAALAKGEYLTFLDGADTMAPWALEVYDRLVEQRVPMLILGQMAWSSGPIPTQQNSKFPREVQFIDYESPLLKDRRFGIKASAFLVERQAFLEVGGWTPQAFPLGLQDLIAKLGFAGRMLLVASPYTTYHKVDSAEDSCYTVAPFVRALHGLLDRDKDGKYPALQKRPLTRCAWFGSLIAYWSFMGILEGQYRTSLALLASGWPMLLFAAIRRIALFILGRHPIETLSLGTPEARFHVPLVDYTEMVPANQETNTSKTSSSEPY